MEWKLSGQDTPLFLPTYTPFEIDGVDVRTFEGGDQNYYLWSDAEQEINAPYIRIDPLGPSEYPVQPNAQGQIEIDGQQYLYAETVIEAPVGLQGVVDLWLTSENGEEQAYQVEVVSISSPLDYDEFADFIFNLDRIDPSEMDS